MNAFIDFYLCKKKLKSTFESASGALKEKSILVLTFRRQEEDCKEVEFAFELPLSPSMGENIIDVLDQAKAGRHSKYLKIAISYFKALIVEKRSIPLNKNLADAIDVTTYGIGSTSQLQFNPKEVIRLKASPNTIEEIIAFSKTTKNKFIVDFNQSLSLELFQDFSERVSLSQLLYVEEPLFKNEIVPSSKFPVWADESMSYCQNLEQILERGFTGFVLKPLHYEFDKLVEVVEAANSRKVPCIIGGVISDSLHACFLGIFQASTRLKVKNLDQSFAGDLVPSLSLMNPYKLNFNNELTFDEKAIRELYNQYEKIYSIKIKI